MEMKGDFLRGKTYEEAFGKEKAKELKSDISIRTKGMTYEEIYGIEKAKEIKQKLSIAFKGKRYEEIMGIENVKRRKEQHPWNAGKKGVYSSDVNHKRSIALRGKKKTEQHKRKIGIANKGNKPRLNMKNTEQSKQKMREARSKIIYPTKDTTIEIKIQEFLKSLGIEFFTHVYLRDLRHPYQCDILIPSLNLIIECDGNYWHNYPHGKEIDHLRTQDLIERGYKVLRLWESEIKRMSLNNFSIKLGSYNE